MVKGKLVLFAIIVLSAYLIASQTILKDIKLPAHATYLVLGFSFLLLVSAFLPYNWGKILREVSYILLFILIIYVGAVLLGPFFQKTEISVEECKYFFFPKSDTNQGGEEGKVSNIIYNALGYTSCILTGYFPAEQSDIGWATFLIFYVILPFTFFFTLFYYLMKGILSTTVFPANAMRVLSFIISLYAARTLTGIVILEILGYGAVGIGLIFAGLLITKATQKLIENWYEVERAAEQVKKVIEVELNAMKVYAAAAGRIIETARAFADTDLNTAVTWLSYLKQIPEYNKIPETEKKILDWMLDYAKTLATDKNKRAFLEQLEKIENHIKTILKKIKTDNTSIADVEIV